ncbi:hypothetical protein EDC04DRAFT_158943 [Pisolithus marmoratus]|nr:hypothetical protein EDC04DRAFT_158943 [Pisolithus marmoratus]
MGFFCFRSKADIAPTTALKAEPPNRELSGQGPYTVVVFGRTGAGISSLVNLIVGSTVAQCHADTRPCTQKTTGHHASFSGKHFCIYDIPGFGGVSSESETIKNIQSLERERGIDVLLYCMRKARATMVPDILRETRRVVPSGVPIVAVVTELERVEGSMESWWTTPSEAGKLANGQALENIGMSFDQHACVTTLPLEDAVHHNTFSERRKQSQEAVRGILLERCRGEKRKPGSSPR